MLQEIHEQPQTLARDLEKYLAPVALAETGLDDAALRSIRKMSIVASGSSRFAGLAGEFMLERLAQLPVKVDYASQYCYRAPLTSADELVVLPTQSGTTADTLHAARVARAQGARTLAICNVPGAPITRETDGVLYTHAGEEVAVAATKSFTAQLLALFALAFRSAEARSVISSGQAAGLRKAARGLPEQAAIALKNDPVAKQLAARFKDASSFMLLGRDVSFPIALEAALKMKETAYIAAEAFPTGEVKHGPTALIDDALPLLMVLTREPGDAASEERYRRSLGILQDLAKQSAKIVVLTNDDPREFEKAGHAVLTVPQTHHLLSPILEIIPLQLLAYHLAVARGVNVDTPRHLSKSVLTE